MNLRLVHRRLAVLMALAALLAFAGGAGFEPVGATLAGIALITALFWQPTTNLSERLERIWLPVALLLVARALYSVFLVGGDVVIPVVDLLLLLLAAEALRALDAPNDERLYALSFALLLASTAYRPGVVFAVAFVSYVSLATVGLMLGYLRRQAESHGVRKIPVSNGFMAVMVGLSGVTLLMSAVVFVAFPRFSRGWAGRGEVLATSIAGFSDQVALGAHGARIFPNPQIVLRVEFPEGRPDNVSSLFWRGRSYDRFDGVSWARSQRLPPSRAPNQWYSERWGGEVVRQDIYAAPLDVHVLFAMHPVIEIEPDSPIQPLIDNAGDFVYWGSARPAYRAYSQSGRPSADQLRQASGRFVPARRFYLQLPELPDRVQQLADSLALGLTNDYDRALAIESWFHREFDYTLDLPSTAIEATVDHFLFERRAGHCEYFSTSMVVLLRALDIPAREVNGFRGGQWSDFANYLAVTQNEAHTWVEVWFPGLGWVPFDPTPASSGSGEALASWFWPGRFMLDGLQHRWNKWILDFSMDDQSSLFSRAAGLFGRGPQEQLTETQGDTSSSGTLLVPALVILTVLVGLVVLRRGGKRLPSEVRMYNSLREACRTAGVAGVEMAAPLGLLALLRTEGRPGGRHAEHLVGLYLRARFSGEQLGDSGRKEMATSLKVARKALKGSSPLRVGSP